MPLICMLQFVFFVISYQAYSRIRPDIVEGSFKRPSVFPLSVACTDRVRVALPILVSACAARANPQLATCHVRDVDADMSPVDTYWMQYTVRSGAHIVSIHRGYELVANSTGGASWDVKAAKSLSGR